VTIRVGGPIAAERLNRKRAGGLDTMNWTTSLRGGSTSSVTAKSGHAGRPSNQRARETASPRDKETRLSLAGHVREGSFITKFRKIFLRDEMNEDLDILPARYGDHEDSSEYEELLPVSPP
jgi:hypothetical protein